MRYTGYLVVPVEELGDLAFDKYAYLKPVEPPTMKNLEAEIEAFCDKYGIDYPSKSTKQEKLDLIATANPTEDYLPTWQEAFDHNPRWLAPRRVKTADGEFIVFKDEFSHLNGEVSKIYDRGQGKPYGAWTIFSHTEILQWIKENEIVDVGHV